MSQPEFNLLATQRAIFKSRLSATEKILLLSIVDHWSREEPKPWPAVSQLERWSGLKRRAVLATVKRLEGRGILAVTRLSGKGNLYDLSHIVAGCEPVHDVHGCTKDTGAPDAPDPCTTSTPPVHHVHPKGPKKEPKKEPKGDAPGESPPMKAADPAQKPKRKAREKRAETVMPADWQPTESHAAQAQKHGLDVKLEADAFRGKSAAKGWTNVCWNGAFKTWLANQVRWDKRDARQRPQRLPTPQRGVVDESVAAEWGKSADSPFAMASGDHERN